MNEKHIPNQNLDDPKTKMAHRDIILNKPFLKRIYIDWYNSFKEYIKKLPDGQLLEIGSGGGFIKDIIPNIVTSDIMPLPCCDMTFNAEKMPFENDTHSAIFTLNVLHHIPNCENFFEESQRILKKGGVLYLIEPANTLVSRFIYQNLHHEPFDPKRKEWQIIDSKGPLSDANGAIPWIVFQRDLDLFHKKYPNLRLKRFEYHTPYKYLLSGGLSKPSLVPYFAYGLLEFLEFLNKPLNPINALFNTIIVEKI